MPRRNPEVELLCLLGAFGACILLGFVDALIPREAAVGVLYAPIVLLAMCSRRRWGVVVIAMLGVALAWLDFFISPDGGDATWALFDRGAATVAIWTCAGLCLARMRAEREIERSFRVESLLRAELDERVRRTLAFLRAMLTLEAGDPQIGREQLVRSLRTRIKGMVEVHDLLSSQRFKPIRMHELVAAVSPPPAPGESSRVRTFGPETLIPPGQVGGLGAVLHELVLHSARHGALSTLAGTLEIRWNISFDAASSSRKMEVVWQEFESEGWHVPARMSAPSLLEPFVKEVLEGNIELAYPTSGAFHRITMLLHEEPDLYSTNPPPDSGTHKAAPAPAARPAVVDHPVEPGIAPGLALGLA
jgi:two-component sensor histidine kinase